jgi:hypothetical protein
VTAEPDEEAAEFAFEDAHRLRQRIWHLERDTRQLLRRSKADRGAGTLTDEHPAPPFAQWAATLRVFLVGFEAITAGQVERAERQRNLAMQGTLRRTAYYDMLAEAEAERQKRFGAWANNERVPRILAELCSAELITATIRLCEDIAVYMADRVIDTGSPCHEQWRATVRDGWLTCWRRAAELHRTGAVPPGPCATHRELVNDRRWREGLMETTSADLATITVAILSGLAEFFDGEARQVAS